MEQAISPHDLAFEQVYGSPLKQATFLVQRFPFKRSASFNVKPATKLRHRHAPSLLSRLPVESPEHNVREEAALLRTMTLLATLSTAAEVRHHLEERRAGRDPSEQEEQTVAQVYLAQAAQDAEELFARLHHHISYEQHAEEGVKLTWVRRFDRLMTVRRITRLLHVMHQRLLSLYPLVSERLVEAGRHLEQQGAALVQGDAEDLLVFVTNGFAFLEGLRDEVLAG